VIRTIPGCLLTIGASFCVIMAAACGPSHSTVKAETPAMVEDSQLKADGYSPFHVPGFGKFDIGIKGHSYEAVIYTGKLTQQVAYSASKKPQPGITITGKGTVVTVTAMSLSQLKDGVKNVATSF
jgi:hypothetical protein